MVFSTLEVFHLRHVSGKNKQGALKQQRNACCVIQLYQAYSKCIIRIMDDHNDYR